MLNSRLLGQVAFEGVNDSFDDKSCMEFTFISKSLNATPVASIAFRTTGLVVLP